MSKINKNKEVLDQLHKMVMKEASAGAKPNNISGVPGQDTSYQSVSEGTETTDKNSVGADKLKPQNYEQKPQTDASTPVKSGNETPAADENKEPVKEAAAPVVEPANEEASTNEVSKMASELLKAIEKMSAAAKPTGISGVPGKDTAFQSVSDKSDTVDKNSIGADKLKPQDYSQKPATDPSKPVAKAAGEEQVTQTDVDKVASYELGRQLAEAIFKQAQEAEMEQIKVAGRRDFELLVAQAQQELEAEAPASQQTQQKIASVDKEAEEKQAEEMGAAVFQDMLKTARYEYAITELSKENESLKLKLADAEKRTELAAKEAKAAVDAKEAFIAKQAAEEQESRKMAAWTDHTAEIIMSKLKNEFLKQPNA